MESLLDRAKVVSSAVAAYEKAVTVKATEARIVATRGKELQQEVSTLKEDVTVYADVALLLQSFSELEQRAIQDKFENLISYALGIIFEDKFKRFRLNAGVERNQVVLNPTLVFVVDGVEVTSGIMGAHGGGPADCVGFLLKLLTVIFNGDSKVRPIIFADESFAHLSEEYLPAMANVIRKFVDELGSDLQIVLVTHQKIFVEKADFAYQFSQNTGGSTVVERIG